ncbi:MAG: thiamine pyrophosphate-dependent enzyme, partial [Oscillospiraceae bacterium]|nr:thiamine pyrophosphate-dependent enzyme [Oscillospiraceae bacterium]
ENWEFGMTITAKNGVINKNTVKGSQFLTPYLEFNGACPGCGEPAYIKLITQLFGDRMIISNATGCSSIWGASAPSIAYSTDRHGKGPAWINPLFEDAAEFGLGIELGIRQMRKSLMSSAKMLLQSSTDENMKISLSGWLEAVRSGSETIEASNNLVSTLEKSAEHDDNMKFILDNRDYLNKKSVWAIGGDGWSYDIGYGGLDHVLSTGADINIFVMDTEVYSNTGGQCSKSTPTAAVAKLAAAGKRRRKKDLGLMAMSYGTVYVAQIAMGADMNQTLKAIIEAEQHPGPSLIIAYSPCVSHGIKSGMGTSVKQQKRAVESGYWHLYRYNPLLKREGKNPFILDSRQPKTEYKEFISSEIRFSQLENVYPDIAPDLYMLSQSNAAERYERYNKLSEQNIF